MQLIAFDQIGNNLVQIGVNALVNAEAKAQLHFKHKIGAKVFDKIFACIRLVGNVDIYKPVSLCTFGALVQNGVQNVAVEPVKGRIV